jgi:DNA/RNA-binding domain of Phe-tRNA-synthetase-like protein
MIPIAFELELPDLLLGVVESRSVPTGPADAALDAEILASIASRIAVTETDPVKTAVRNLLRVGGYKPAGRGKPASEYLAQSAERGEFPRISHIVDALNLVSLESRLPISLLDADRVMDGTDALVVRFGHAGESYVFNSAGHEINIEGLVSVARQNGPAVGNPVKDSMMAKTTDATTHTIAFIWGSRSVLDPASMQQICQRLGRLLGGTQTEIRVIEKGPVRPLL